MTQFWRRWHITLGSWFREYVYIPLGGNQKGNFITTRNLLFVWILTGMWHGAGCNFILWGAALFLLIWTEKFFTGRFLERTPLAGRLYMLFFIPLTWALFAIDDPAKLGLFFSRLFPFFGRGPWSLFRYDYLKYLKLYYPFFLTGILFSTRLPFRILKGMFPKRPLPPSGIPQNVRRSNVLLWLLSAVILTASALCMYRGLDDPFLYFRF